MKKHDTREAGDTLGTAAEITDALKTTNHVDQMIALQELGLEVIPVQGAEPIQEPWTRTTDDKKFEKLPGGRPMTPEEWEEWAPTVSRKKSHREDGSPKHWKQYDSRTPLEFYATEETLDFIDNKYHGAGVIFQNGLIGIDADTPEEVAHLEEWLIEHCSSRTQQNKIKTSGVPFTVSTPGKVSLNEDGQPVWNHSGGGHLWIRMPEGWADGLPDRANEKITIGDKGSSFDIKRGGGYFVTPGSTRSEGAYQLTGEVLEASVLPGLVEAVKEAFTPEPAPTPEPARNISFTPGNSGKTTAERIEEWSDHRPWSSIFNELGWANSSLSCSGDCVEFTHPDSASGSHSGIAHGLHCTTGPVPDAVTIYSSTAQAATGLEGVVKKYRFVLEVFYKGDTNAFFQSEPIQEDTLTPQDNRKTQGEKGEEKQEKNDNAFKPLLEATKARMFVRENVSGGFSYLPITKKGIVNIDQGEDWAADRIRNIPKGSPATDTVANKVLSRLRDDASDARAKGDIPKADAVPRFWSQAAGDDLTQPVYIYRGADDWAGTRPPFYKIDADGYEEDTGGDSDAIFIEREDFSPIDADLNATVRGLEDLWRFINVPEHARVLILGALITAWVSPKATRPILFCSGPSGTGKTLTTERLAALIDPKTGGETTVSTTGGGEQINQAGLGNETLVIGNVSRISRGSSDAIAQLGGSSTKVERTLYKNGRNSAFILRATALISTKETGMVLQDDFLNRVIPILPEHLTSDQKRRGTQEQEWLKALPRFRGALMKLVAEVKRDAIENPERDFSRSYRWQTVGETIERVEVVLSRYGMEPAQPWAHVLKKELHRLKGDSLPQIIEWIRDELTREVSGSPTQVFEELVKEAGGKNAPGTAGWIKNPKGLTKLLKDYTDVLEDEGINVTIGDRYPDAEKNRERLVTITPRKENRLYDFREDIEEIL